MLPLIGLAILVGGFAVRINPLLIVAVAAVATGLAAGLPPLAVVAALGKAFNDNRYVSLALLVLPVIGLLEGRGLQDRARALVARLKGATTGQILLAYFVVRQATAAMGLIAVAGQAATVRPVLAPMAEGAAERQAGRLDARLAARVRALAAATDNLAVFYGEDIFIALAPILLIKGVLAASGYDLNPLQLSVWALPGAVAAVAIHAGRMAWLDRTLRRAGPSAPG